MYVKQFFRWLIAELDGFYVQTVGYFLNNCVDSIKRLFLYFKQLTLVLPDDVVDGQSAFTYDDLLGVGAIAGVYPPYVTAESILGSLQGTQSKIINGVQRSERGLYDVENEAFEFIRTERDEYSTDINTEASETRLTSLVEPGAQILGYIPESAKLFDSEGNMDLSVIVPEAGTEEVYQPWFGAKYMYLAEVFLLQQAINYEVFYKLFIVMQKIRYNGASIKTFLDITELLMEDYIQDITFVSYGSYINVEYTQNGASELRNRTALTYIWKYCIQHKFPQIVVI